MSVSFSFHPRPSANAAPPLVRAQSDVPALETLWVLRAWRSNRLPRLTSTESQLCLTSPQQVSVGPGAFRICRLASRGGLLPSRIKRICFATENLSTEARFILASSNLRETQTAVFVHHEIPGPSVAQGCCSALLLRLTPDKD